MVGSLVRAYRYTFYCIEELSAVDAQDLGFSIAAHETMACQYDGDDLTIGFKSPFIIEILSNMTCGEVVMKFLDSKRAALIVPAADEEESNKICGIIMPIMIS